MPKSYDELIAKCANAVANCWNHYVDTPLCAEEIGEIRRRLHGFLPETFTTKAHDDYAKQRQQQVDFEQESEE